MRTQYLFVASLFGILLVGFVLLVARTQFGTTTSAAIPGTATIIAPTLSPSGSPPASPTIFITAGAGTVVPQNTIVIPSGIPAPQFSPPPTPDPNGSPVVGYPAINPRIATTDPLTPAITAPDTISYVQSHPFIATKAEANGPITVTNVQFLTAKQVKAQIGMDLNLAPDRLLCVVTISGTFTISRPNGPQKTSTQGYEFFDAHTGNYLAVNIRP